VCVIIERITLGAACERPETVRQLLVARLIGALRRRFDLALAAVRNWMGLVVGVGAVVVLHSPTTMTVRPATLHPALTPKSRKTHHPLTLTPRRAAA